MIGQVLQRCGDELTRDNLRRQATTLKDAAPAMFIDGIGVYNSPTDYRAIHHLQPARFDGTTLVSLGAPVSLDDAGQGTSLGSAEALPTQGLFGRDGICG
jgi:branched-chain amino acid transport system substrate-binding protein